MVNDHTVCLNDFLVIRICTHNSQTTNVHGKFITQLEAIVNVIMNVTEMFITH